MQLMPFQNGMDVEHEKFGFGKIVSLEGSLPDVKATVFFQGLEISNYY